MSDDKKDKDLETKHTLKVKLVVPQLDSAVKAVKKLFKKKK